MTIRSLRSIARGQNPTLFPPHATVGEVARQMREREVSAAMVVDGSRLAGIFTELVEILATRDVERD
jgi:CBS domain-containing protein